MLCSHCKKRMAKTPYDLCYTCMMKELKKEQTKLKTFHSGGIMNEKEKLYNVKIELKIPAKDEKEAEHIFWEYVDDMFNDIHPDIEEVED